MIRTRVLRPGDSLSDLVELSGSFFKEYEKYHKDFFALKGLKKVHIENFFTKSINSRNSRTVIATENTKTVGYISFSAMDREPFYEIKKIGHISGLMVSREHRNKGVGKILLREAKRWFVRKGIEYFCLETSVDNELGVEFYKRNQMKPLRIQFIGNVE